VTTSGMSLHVSSISRFRGPIGIVAAFLVLLVGAAVGARWSPAVFVAFILALVAIVGVAAFRWPRVAIVIVVVGPVLDRYIVADLLPDGLETAAHYLSEGLLLVVGLILAARAWRDGRLVAALVHPVTAALLAFTALGLVSAVVNGVPLHIAVIGLVFTLDAAALFFLPRVVGFTMRQSLFAIAAIGAIVLLAAILTIGQALLSPRILGFEPIRGRFGELGRLASFFGDPNVFGAFLVATVPFPLLMATRLATPMYRRIAGAVAFVLLLALWLSFSRGSWIALVLGVGVVLLIVDRKTLLLGLLLCVFTFGVANYMPRDLLVPERGPRQPNLVDSTIDRVEIVGRGGDLRTLFAINAVPILADHPLLGVGPGRYGGAVAHNFGTPIYDRYDHGRLFWNPTQRTVDNFWLHILVEAGIVGFVAFLAAAMIPGVRILLAARRAIGWRRIMLGGAAAGTAGMAVSSLTTMLLEANSIGFLFWFMLAIGSMVAAAAPRSGASAEGTDTA
jgi:putative inorganic carbon (hco3(-)) transporter